VLTVKEEQKALVDTSKMSHDDTQLFEGLVASSLSIIHKLNEDIAEENLNVFRPNRGGTFEGVRNRKNCKVSESEVETYMSKASDFTRYKMTDTQNRASMRFAGAFPENYGILDGLSSVSISVDDNGVYTDYVLEDKIIKPPSLSVLQQFLRKTSKPIKPQKSGGSINPVTKQDLRRVRDSIQNYDSTPGPS
jgi:hypothetical protein